MDKLTELSDYLGDVVKDMEAKFGMPTPCYTYMVKYVDNSDTLRMVKRDAITFAECMDIIETEANEEGHGIQSICGMSKHEIRGDK